MNNFLTTHIVLFNVTICNSVIGLSIFNSPWPILVVCNLGSLMAIAAYIVSLYHMQDPHYNGPPDTDRILGENHVAWHGLDLFQDFSFYNFCMPQLPASVS